MIIKNRECMYYQIHTCILNRIILNLIIKSISPSGLKNVPLTGVTAILQGKYIDGYSI
jgi:hypothetical protein